jgi:hypothetical protein
MHKFYRTNLTCGLALLCFQTRATEQELNEAFITDDNGSTIHLTEEAEMFVTFIHEGAGYKTRLFFYF